MSLEIKLIGYPEVYNDSKKIVFPFKKAEGILYMLLIEKRIERDKLCTFFWPENSTKTAKKNLRNAIYNLRKLVGDDIIISPKRSLIEINYDKIIKFDVDIIFEKKYKEEKSIDWIINRETYEFIEGFHISDLVEFQEWLQLQRKNFNEELKNYLSEFCDNYEIDIDKKIEILKTIIKLDEFDENNYLKLINLYKEKGHYQKSIETFNDLKDLLEKELAITPSKEIYQVIEKIMLKRRIDTFKKRKEKAFSFGRDEEFRILNYNYSSFMDNKDYKNSLISGEPGIGKTNLIDSFKDSINKKNIYMVNMKCYQLEEEYYYECWKNPLEELSNIIKNDEISIPDYNLSILKSLFPTINFNVEAKSYLGEERNFRIVEKAIIDLFNIIAKKKKIVFIIEDIHWIDTVSLQLLRALLNQEKINMITFLTSRNVVRDEIEKFIYHLKYKDRLEQIELERFSKFETKELIKHFIDLSEEYHDIIWKESEGNPLFIIEYVNNIQQNNNFNILNSKSGDVIKSRVLNLPENSKKILEICSVFLESIKLDLIEELLEKSRIEIIDNLDDLLKRKILVEDYDSNDGLLINFSHNKIKTYLYNQMSSSKRKLLHMKFSEYWERKINNTENDRSIYPYLIHHFNKSGNNLKLFKYRLKRFSGLVMVNHEMFPEMEDYNINNGQTVYLDEKEVEQNINNLNELYSKLSKKENSKEFKELEIIYLYIIGRMEIDIGNENKGLELIRKMIKIAEDIDNNEYIIKGCFKLIHLAINTFDLELMRSGIDYAEKKVKDEGQFGKIKRLKGFMYILKGDYQLGEKLLVESIEIFEFPEFKNRYILNKAAAYLYLGESRRLQQDFEKALCYYDQCYNICNEKKLLSGMAFTLANKGRILYEKGLYEESKKILNRSLKYYDKIVFLWGRYISYGYLALIYAQYEKYEKSYNYLKKSFFCINKNKNNYEKGVLCRIKAEIIIKTKKYKDRMKFLELIQENMINCCSGELKCFENTAMTYESKLINNYLKDETVREVLK